MSKEAMKLALEALKRMKGYGNTFAYRSHEQNPHEQVCDAITALEALAEQKSGIKQVIELYDSPDQPTQQEPVAFEEWLAKQHGDPEEIGFLQALRIAYIAGQDSITSPQTQRTWVGLTYGEVLSLRKDDPLQFYKAIEAKLKEKNT